VAVVVVVEVGTGVGCAVVVVQVVVVQVVVQVVVVQVVGRLVLILRVPTGRRTWVYLIDDLLVIPPRVHARRAIMKSDGNCLGKCYDFCSTETRQSCCIQPIQYTMVDSSPLLCKQNLRDIL